MAFQFAALRSAGRAKAGTHSTLFFRDTSMKYARYSFAGLGLLLILVYAGNWVFAKEYLGSPFASSTMGRGIIIWGALATCLLANTWKERIAFAGLGGLGAWALLYGVYFYHMQIFPIA